VIELFIGGGERTSSNVWMSRDKNKSSRLLCERLPKDVSRVRPYGVERIVGKGMPPYGDVRQIKTEHDSVAWRDLEVKCLKIAQDIFRPSYTWLIG